MCVQGCEDQWLFFEAKKGSAGKKFGERWFIVFQLIRNNTRLSTERHRPANEGVQNVAWKWMKLQTVHADCPRTMLEHRVVVVELFEC